MISKEQFEVLTKSLKNIDEKLEILIILQKRALPKPSVGDEEKKVLKLCDRKHTIDDIVKATGKSENSVNIILTRLRDKVLIKSVEINDTIVYQRI